MVQSSQYFGNSPVMPLGWTIRIHTHLPGSTSHQRLDNLRLGCVILLIPLQLLIHYIVKALNRLYRHLLFKFHGPTVYFIS